MWTDKKRQVCYVGLLDRVHKIDVLMEAMANKCNKDIRLILAGSFVEKDDGFSRKIRAFQGLNQVTMVGQIPYDQVISIMAQSRVGILLLERKYQFAKPNKLFEYMASGIPVIASDFPPLREIIEGNDCGICVDPTDPSAIAQAINYLLDHPEEAERMGRNGRLAVEKKYLWATEEKKLLEFYEGILKG
jgi:glycosyltransferase involved in cell wall biosynthesis